MAVFEKHHKKAKKSSKEPSLEEEDAYKRKVKWLCDHGDSDSKETGVSSEQTNESDWKASVGAINSSNTCNKKLFNECYASTASLLRPKKNTYDHKKLSSKTIGYVQTSTKQAKRKVKNKVLCMQILLNSGCGATLINKKFVNNSKSTKDKKLDGLQKLESLILIENVK